MEKSEILMVVLIGMLVITTALQTIQLVGMGNGQVSAPSMSMAGNTPMKASGSPSAPTSLQNLPSMVGGC